MTDIELPLGQLRIPHFPVPGRPHDGELAAGRMPARARAPLRDRHARASGAPRLRARRDPVDGLRGLLPDRGRLHRVRPRAADPDHVPGLSARLDRDLHAGDHAGRPDPLPAAVRALPQPRPGDDAGHRRRLRGRPTRGGDRLRQAQVRPGPRGPDHHLRHDAGPRGDPRRGPRPGPLLRRGRPDRQGDPEPAGHQARRGAPDLAGPARARSTPTRPSSGSSTSPGSSRASPATPPRTPPAWSSAASR